MTGTLSPTAVRPQPVALRPSEGPAPGVLETIRAGFRLAEDERELTQAGMLAERYDDLLDTLRDLGVDTGRDGRLYRDAEQSDNALGGGYMLRTPRVPDRDAIIAEVQRQRATHPDRFGTVGKTREEFDRQVVTRFGGHARDQMTAARGGRLGTLWGGLASGMTDEINLATLLIGAGEASLLKTILIDGLVGAGTEVVNLPGTARAKARMGESFTAADATEQVLLSGGASAVLGGSMRGIELTAPKASAAADAVRGRFEQAIADNWDKLPEAVRTRWGSAAKIGDVDLPDLVEMTIGRGNLSADERAAVDAVRRDAEIDATSPFKPGIAGDAAHRQAIGARLSELLQPVARQPYRAMPPAQAVPTGRGALNSGTSLSTGAPATGPRAALKAKIRRAESGGNDAAKNPLSSATGRYQFTRGTWLAYYKRRFGSQGLDDAAILAKRGDGRLQETLMDDLTADNAAFLRSAGEAETAGNLYLTHFAGQGGARKLFAADPGADAGAVLGAGVVKANPWMEGMTAGDVIAWAHRKMNEAPPRRAGARAELAEGAAPVDRVAAVQAELDRVAAEADAARGVRDAEAEARIAAALDAEPVAVDLDDADLARIAEAPVRRDAGADRMSDREAALLPALRAEIAGTARLSDVAALAKRLEATQDEIKLSLQRIAEADRSIVANKKGVYRRVPTDRGPVDAYKFLARKGGLTPHGLDVGVEYIPKAKLVGAEKNKGHDLIGIFNTKARSKSGGRRDQSILVPGAGPLIRPNGMSIDDAGELLFEAGYLRGADGGRPTTAETIAYLEQGMTDGPARLLPGNRETEMDAWVAPETLADMRVQMGEWAQYQEVDLTPDDIDALARLMMRDDIANEDAALAALIDDAVLDALNDMRYESGDYDADLSQALDHFDAGSRVGGRAPDPRDAGEGGARGEAGDDWPEPVDESSFAGWDDPAGAVAAQQADSIIHDIEADMFGGATQAERRQALERQGDGPLDNGVAQKPAGSDGGLFDAAAGRQTEFALDENGEVRSWADIAAELDADEAEIKAIRDCL